MNAEKGLWRDTYGVRGFEIADAQGVVLAVLPPLTRIESEVGETKASETELLPPGGYAAARYQVRAAYWGETPGAPLLTTGDQQAAYMAAHDYAAGHLGDEAWIFEWTDGEHGFVEALSYPEPEEAEVVLPDPPTPRPRPPKPPEDNYTYERAPFSSVWFAIGDGLPREKPRPGPPGGATYRASPAYWGDTPSSVIVQSGDAAAVYQAAYDYMVANKADTVVAEWRSDLQGYDVVDTFAYPRAQPKTIKPPKPPHPPRPRGKSSSGNDKGVPTLVLTCEYEYMEGQDVGIIHSAQIERACAVGTQLLFRGRTLATFAGTPANLYSYKTGERMRQITHTLTLYTTVKITAQELMRRQML